jgi:hypothetical protein
MTLVSIKTLNLLASALVISLLVGEFALSSFTPIPPVRILQFLILFNILTLGFRIIKNSIIYILAVFFFMIHAFFYLDVLYVTSDLINILWWTTFVFIVNYYIRNEKDFELLKSAAIKLSFFWTSVAALLGLYKLKLIISDDIKPWMEFRDSITGQLRILPGTSLSGDYNVFSIGLYCGFLSGLYIYKRLKNAYGKIVMALMLLMIILSSALSTSRRAILLAPIFLIIYIFSTTKGINFSRSLKLNFKLNPNFWPWKTIIVIFFILGIIPRIEITRLLNESILLKSYIERIISVEDITSGKEVTRTERWNFSWEYFKKLPFENKIIGDGFKYAKILGEEFQESSIDHPHNFFISSLLYGGILGFFFTSLLTIMLLYKYYLHRKKLDVVAGWFILFIFLSFTSSNSIFSSRLGIFLLLFPLINYFELKRIKKLLEKT